MAKQPEAKFKTKVMQVLKDARGVYQNFVIAPNDAITRGISDLLISWQGIFVALELKINTPVSELQRAFLQEVRLGGGMSGVLRLKDEKAGLVEMNWTNRAGALSLQTIIFPLQDLPKVLRAEAEMRGLIQA